MTRDLTFAATITLMALAAPGISSAKPACDAIFAQVHADISQSNLPGDDEPGAVSDKTSLMKKARSARTSCIFGNKDDATKTIASIYKHIPQDPPTAQIARMQ